MRLIDKQIDSLCRGHIPPSIRAFYSTLGVQLPATILPLVEPYDETLVNPASIDVRVGETALLKRSDGEWESVDLTRYSEENPYPWQPFISEYWDVDYRKHFTDEMSGYEPVVVDSQALVATLETFNLPNFLTGIFKLKSSRAREFYQHMLAGFCDPGWHGSKLTMELLNFSTEPLPLYPGLKIGQIVFDLTFGIPEYDYSTTGRYNKDNKVNQSKG